MRTLCRDLCFPLPPLPFTSLSGIMYLVCLCHFATELLDYCITLSHSAAAAAAISPCSPFSSQYNSWISQTGLKKEIIVLDDNAVHYGIQAQLPPSVPR